ncbi:hypothetical protein Ddye_016956 [Dipteronia dyeriana]|uniref:Reverse transcriptase n=1 Tax=Dipteronia dyeriana TaxID=168575 RepID=A0AAD9U8M3_9ROSI|nr:hypothetical protein Ddye_016956 [Dipteronia dyeriana]
MRCVTSVSYSFLVNRVVCGFLKPSRGLRQGDLLAETERTGDVSGFRCSSGGLKISHMFFADDSMFFSQASKRDCCVFRQVLDWYALASRQLINFQKLALCVNGRFSRQRAVMLARIVGVQLVECHERYLGIPSFTGRNKRAFFANIRDRVWDKLKGWQEKLFSTGGKEVLLKTVIQAIPTYSMSLFKLPLNLVSDIQRLCARFWWGSSTDN